MYNSDHRFQRSNGILDNQFKINGLYYTAYLKQSNSQKIFKKVRPVSAKNERVSENLVLGNHEINPIPEENQSFNEPQMLNSMSMDSIE